MGRQLIITLILILIGGANYAIATEKIDSLSYAFGHQSTLVAMSDKKDLMQSESDFQNYIRGLEENYRDYTQMKDSSYIISYCLGAMEAVFMTDGVHGKKKEDLPPFPCIIAGLRRVQNGEIRLPADTVAAMTVIRRYSGEGRSPENLDADASCKFFEAYGTMKAYQPGLQEYINGLNPGTRCVTDRKAYATGMADVFEAYTEVPKTAYDMGRYNALSINISALDNDSPDRFSFLAGAKAALGLGKELIPRDEVESILALRCMDRYKGNQLIEHSGNFGTVMEYYDKIDVELDSLYEVNWTVSAATVADVNTEAYQPFADMISMFDIADDCIPGILMAHPRHKAEHVYVTALFELEKFSLPEGYKWFLGRNIDGQTTIGIMDTDKQFKAKVHKASVCLDPMSGMINVEWKYDVEDALRWAEFTAANIGKFVAMEIDGVFMFAPRVNQQISGGACSISSLSPEVINRLFKDSKKVRNQTTADTIEVIEIE